MTEFPVTMCALIEIHEVHVHGVPRNLPVVLCVEVEKRLAELLHSVDPHLGRGEGVHPCDHTDTSWLCLCRSHDVCHFL